MGVGARCGAYRCSCRMQIVACLVAALGPATRRDRAASADTWQSRYFTTSDGVRLHYLEAGPRRRSHDRLCCQAGRVPTWIWQPQIQAFAQR